MPTMRRAPRAILSVLAAAPLLLVGVPALAQSPSPVQVLDVEWTLSQLAGEAVVKLNELECVDGEVWSNVWETPYIVRIDPATGVVTGILDMTGLAVPDPSASDPGAVLNGIAYDPERGTFLLTGKLWPTMYEVRVAD